jgi:hypothetical protein
VWLDAIWRFSPLITLVIVGLWWLYVSTRQFYPPVGVYIAVLAFLAVVVTIWPPNNPWTKAAWLIVFFCVMKLEVDNLFHDRLDNQNKEAQRRKGEQGVARQAQQDEDDRFAGLMKSQQDSFADVLKGSQKQLIRSERIMSKSEEAASFAGGGDSFPFVFSGVVTRETGEKQMGFYLQKQGKYPLYDLAIRIGRPYFNGETIQLFGVKKDFSELHDTGSHPVLFDSFPTEHTEYYLAAMDSRNGNWYAVIEIVTINRNVAARWIVYDSITHNVLQDFADSSFPPEERRKKMYPLSGLPLPDASEHTGQDKPIFLLREGVTLQ